MKKNFNVIQIKGIKGLILALGVVCCLAAGFIVFPGWLGMNIWNAITSQTSLMPTIGLFQGILLWGILITTYFLFRKEKVVVCLKSPQGLSEEELKEVFGNIKKQSIEEPIIQAMLKAREAELKYKNFETTEKTESETVNQEQSTKL